MDMIKEQTMEKRKIYVDRNGEGSFYGGLQNVIERSTELLKQFNSLQPWVKIQSYEDWLRLVASPQAYYDNIILENVKLSETSGLKPNLELLSGLFDVPREAFISIVQGITFDEEGCKPCKTNRLKIRKGKPAISLGDFREYEGFLIFSPEGFTQDEARVKEKGKTFEKYTQTEEELELVRYWDNLAAMLNSHFKRGYFGPVKLEEACKLFGLRYVTGIVYVNEETVYYDILKRRTK